MQTRTIELPSDSNFAVAMKNQKEAERAEQQRIKNLVLNLNDTQEHGESDGIDEDFFLQPNPNLRNHNPMRSNAHLENKGFIGEKHQHNPSIQQSVHHSNTRPSDKPGTHRGGHRARKLQLSDVNWYEKYTSDQTVDPPKPPPRFGRAKGRGRGRGYPRRTPG